MYFSLTNRIVLLIETSQTLSIKKQSSMVMTTLNSSASITSAAHCMEKQLLSKSLGLYGWAEESFLVHATVNGSVVFRLRINSFRHNNTFGYGRSLKDSYLGITFESRFGCLSFVMWKQSSIALTFCAYQAFEKARYRIKMCSIASIFKNLYV